MHRVRCAVVAALSLLMPAGLEAQETVRPLKELAEHLQRPLADQGPRPGTWTMSGADGVRRVVMPGMFAQDGGQSAGSASQRSPTRTVLGAIVGATGGFFAGGFTGAWIEGDRCNCDDPGFVGFLIGAPVGAVAGGILGGFYLF